MGALEFLRRIMSSAKAGAEPTDAEIQVTIQLPPHVRASMDKLVNFYGVSREEFLRKLVVDGIDTRIIALLSAVQQPAVQQPYERDRPKGGAESTAETSATIQLPPNAYASAEELVNFYKISREKFLKEIMVDGIKTQIATLIKAVQQANDRDQG